MQNFFDANRDQLSEFRVIVEDTEVTISGPAPFELLRLSERMILPAFANWFIAENLRFVCWRDTTPKTQALVCELFESRALLLG